MLKPKHVVKVGELLNVVKDFQKMFDELKDDEFACKKILIDLVSDHLKAGKQIKSSEVIRYLDNN